MIIQGTVGLPNYSDGANPGVTLGKQGEMSVSELDGRYYTQSYRGNVFHSSMYGTVASANIGATGAGGTPWHALWNTSPNKNLVILKVGVSTQSGTAGGAFGWYFGQLANITSTFSTNPLYAQPRPAMLGAVANSVALGYGQIAMTGLPTMSFVKWAYNLSNAGVTFQNGLMMEDVGGDIIVPPGGVLALNPYAVGSSHVPMTTITWEEVLA